MTQERSYIISMRPQRASINHYITRNHLGTPRVEVDSTVQEVSKSAETHNQLIESKDEKEQVHLEKKDRADVTKTTQPSDKKRINLLV